MGSTSHSLHILWLLFLAYLVTISNARKILLSSGEDVVRESNIDNVASLQNLRNDPRNLPFFNNKMVDNGDVVLDASVDYVKPGPNPGQNNQSPPPPSGRKATGDVVLDASVDYTKPGPSPGQNNQSPPPPSGRKATGDVVLDASVDYTKPSPSPGQNNQSPPPPSGRKG